MISQLSIIDIFFSQYELEQQLCLFARDEVMTWQHGRGKPWTFDLSFRTNVANMIEGVVKRAETMACKPEREQVKLQLTRKALPLELTICLFCRLLRLG